MEDPKDEVLDAYCRIFSKVEEWDEGEQLIAEGVGETSFKIFQHGLRVKDFSYLLFVHLFL